MNKSEKSIDFAILGRNLAYVQPESTDSRAPFGGCLSKDNIEISYACSTAPAHASIFLSHGAYRTMYYMRATSRLNGSTLSQSSGSGGCFQSSVAGDTQQTSCTRAPKSRSG